MTEAELRVAELEGSFAEVLHLVVLALLIEIGLFKRFALFDDRFGKPPLELCKHASIHVFHGDQFAEAFLEAIRVKVKNEFISR